MFAQRIYICYLAALLCFLFSLENVLGEEIYSCHYLSQEPVLDGQLEKDPAWKDICQSDYFFTLHSKIPALKKTFFKMGYTPDALYIGVQCQEPVPRKIKAEFTDDGPLWEEDSVELFISPKACDRYSQFIINSIGSRWSQLTQIPLKNWQASSHKGKDYWSTEVRIPFENFFAIPQKGEVWSANVCRNIYTGGDKHLTWVQLDTGGFHQPDHFGKIIFMDNIPLEKRKKAERVIIEKLKKKIRTNLSSVLKNHRKITREVDQLDNLEKVSDVLKKSDELVKYLKYFDNISDFGVCRQGSCFIMNVGTQKFIVGKDIKERGWLNIENVSEKNSNNNTINTNLSAYAKGWVHFDKDTEQIKIVKDTNNEKILYLKVKGHRLEENKRFNLEVNLRIIKDIPCLLIYQRVANPFSSSRKFVYGSYTSNISAYAGDGFEIKAVTPGYKKWHSIHNGHWLWVGKEAGQLKGKKGLGIISYIPASFCLLGSKGSNSLYWGYNTGVVVENGRLEYKMAVMAAESPEEVKSVYEKIKNIELSPFIYPDK